MEMNEVSQFEAFLCSPEGRDISSRILEHLVKAEGGLQAVLNLRRVCSVTKKLVDELPVNEGRRIFSNAIVRFGVEFEGILSDRVLISLTLEKFLESPPPKHITSLRLIGLSDIPDEECHDLKRLCNFWGGKDRCLRSVEVDFLDLTTKLREGFMHELWISTSFRSLNAWNFMLIPLGADFPEFIFNIEDLLLDRGILRDNEENQVKRPSGDFYDRLLLSKSLRSFSIADGDWPTRNIVGVKHLIEAKMNDQGFRLQLEFTGHISCIDEELANLVANSKSKIKLRFSDYFGCFTVMCERLSETIRDEVMGKFLSCVVTVYYKEFAPMHLSRLSNLQTININTPLNEENVSVISVNQLPRSLKELNLFKQAGLPVFKRLFNGTHLTLGSLAIRFTGNEKDMMELLTDIDCSFPNLTSLDIGFCLTDVESPDEASKSEENFGKPFPNLRFLSIFVGLDSNEPALESTVNLYRRVLLNGFQLPSLPVLYFQIHSGDRRNSDPLNLVNKDFLNLLLAGEFGKTVCDIGIDHRERLIGEDEEASDLSDILWEKAEMNRLRLQETYGLPDGISREDIVQKRFKARMYTP